MQQRQAVAATSLSYVLVILDTSIVNVALEPIALALHSNNTALQWVVSAYTLSFGCLLLGGGALADRFGARRLYLHGLLLFTLASLLCGLAGNGMTLVAARVLQGMGAAMLVPASLALINQAYLDDPVGRAKAIGIWAGCGGIAMAAGPLVGGVLIETLGWRSIFLANLPLGLIAIGLSARLAASAPQPRASVWRAVQLFGNRVFSACVAVSLVSALLLYGLMFLLSLYFQRTLGFSPLRTGAAFLPLTVMVSLGSLMAGELVRAFGSRWLIGGALFSYAVGFTLLLMSVSTPDYALIVVPMPLIGLAAGLITPAATAALMNGVQKEQAGVAAGILNTARQIGAALGVALAGGLL
ncbi:MULTISPECIES: MFS transporter [Pseudomonas]|uniref:MFS transporter n=1 Tax=Pseudomonas TaxID=286 RepID=UPI0008121901|nr:MULTISPECIES: MFS transporter [unclassified Pseudomonas]MBW8127286.1 MFS transporter [Pseudomonas sp. LAP_36]MBW8134693.1 MFS transporter [Pseudomonas sp. PAMC 26818]CRM61113.1 Spectinomycin tetracycline efflux pump [Pseudomonas sp. 24 R 17]